MKKLPGWYKFTEYHKNILKASALIDRYSDYVDSTFQLFIRNNRIGIIGIHDKVNDGSMWSNDKNISAFVKVKKPSSKKILGKYKHFMKKLGEVT